MVEPLLLFILAHVVADFLLQSPKIAAEKCGGDLRGYLKHFAGHIITLAVLTHRYLSPAMAVLWLVLPVSHLLIDWLKNRFFPPRHPQDAAIFLLDQAVHLVLIFFAWQWVHPGLSEPAAVFYVQRLIPAGELISERLFAGANLPPFALIAVVYGYIIFGGAVLVRKVLDMETLRLPGSAEPGGDARQSGRVIGMLERALILTLTLAGAFTSIAFVLTAKSIARYKELEKRDFAEYFLVGTLLSTLLAVLGGLLLKSAAL